MRHNARRARQWACAIGLFALPCLEIRELSLNRLARVSLSTPISCRPHSAHGSHDKVTDWDRNTDELS
jgi:hypothetical protein